MCCKCKIHSLLKVIHLPNMCTKTLPLIISTEGFWLQCTCILLIILVLTLTLLLAVLQNKGSVQSLFMNTPSNSIGRYLKETANEILIMKPCCDLFKIEIIMLILMGWMSAKWGMVLSAIRAGLDVWLWLTIDLSCCGPKINLIWLCLLLSWDCCPISEMLKPIPNNW